MTSFDFLGYMKTSCSSGRAAQQVLHGAARLRPFLGLTRHSAGRRGGAGPCMSPVAASPLQGGQTPV